MKMAHEKLSGDQRNSVLISAYRCLLRIGRLYFVDFVLCRGRDKRGYTLALVSQKGGHMDNTNTGASRAWPKLSQSNPDAVTRYPQPMRHYLVSVTFSVWQGAQHDFFVHFLGGYALEHLINF